METHRIQMGVQMYVNCLFVVTDLYREAKFVTVVRRMVIMKQSVVSAQSALDVLMRIVQVVVHIAVMESFRKQQKLPVCQQV